MNLRNITRHQFADAVENLCRIYSERADTIGREQGWLAPACVELLALDLFIAGTDSRPVQSVRAYLAAGCAVSFKGELTYTLVRYEGLDYYVEGEVEAHQLSPRAVLVADGIQLPEGDGGVELLDLPEGALAHEPDPDDRGDHMYDQERDDRLTGDR